MRLIVCSIIFYNKDYTKPVQETQAFILQKNIQINRIQKENSD